VNRERYRELLRIRADLIARSELLMADFDALILPASSGPAPEGFEYTGARTLLIYSTFLGIPAFSLP